MDLFLLSLLFFLIASAWIYALRFLYAMGKRRAERDNYAHIGMEEIEEYVRKRRGIS